MWWIILAGAGAGLLAYLTKKPSSPKTDSPPGENISPPSKSPDVNASDLSKAGALAAGLGSSAGIMAAGLALSAATAALGKKLTGDAGGAVVGGLNSVSGTAVNVGRVAGKEIDILLGGSGVGATGAISQATLGTVAFIGTSFGWLTAIGTLGLGSLVYAVASVVTDLERLAYGQAGAEKDYYAQRETVRNEIKKVVSTFKLSENTAWQALAVERVSAHIADGVMLRTNQAAYDFWMRRPRGIGVSVYGHAKWGRDRGMFRGNVNSAGELIVDWPSSDKNENFVGFNTPPKARTNGELVSYRIGVGTLEKIVTPIRVDSEARFGHQVGAIIANAKAYERWMNEPVGLGVDTRGHAQAGLNAGYFSGTVKDDGSLYENGLTWNYNRVDGKNVLALVAGNFQLISPGWTHDYSTSVLLPEPGETAKRLIPPPAPPPVPAPQKPRLGRTDDKY